MLVDGRPPHGGIEARLARVPAARLEADAPTVGGPITVPGLVLWGEHDGFCPRADQESLALAIHEARLVNVSRHRPLPALGAARGVGGGDRRLRREPPGPAAGRPSGVAGARTAECPTAALGGAAPARISPLYAAFQAVSAAGPFDTLTARRGLGSYLRAVLVNGLLLVPHRIRWP